MKLKNKMMNRKIAFLVILCLFMPIILNASPGESIMKLSNINYTGESRNIESLLLKIDNFLLHIAKENDVKIIKKNINITKKFFIVKSFHYEYILSVNNDYKLFFDIYANKNKGKLNYTINIAVSWIPNDDSDFNVDDILKSMEEEIYLYSQENKWNLNK